MFRVQCEYIESEFVFNDTTTTDIYSYCHTRSLHDALPIWSGGGNELLYAVGAAVIGGTSLFGRSEEHTSEFQSLMRISYAVRCLKKTKNLRPAALPRLSTEIMRNCWCCCIRCAAISMSYAHISNHHTYSTILSRTLL